MQAIRHKLDTDLPWYQEILSAVESLQASESSVNLRGLRKRAKEYFLQTGFPSSAKEEWRYTNLVAYLGVDGSKAFVVANPKLAPKPHDLSAILSLVSALPSPQFVFVNGILASKAESPVVGRYSDNLNGLVDIAKGLPAEIGGVATITDNPSVAFNSAAFLDAVLIVIPEQVRLESPIHIIWATTQAEVVSCPRLFVSIGKGSSVSVIETHLGCFPTEDAQPRYFNCGVSELIAADGSQLEHTKLVFEGTGGIHVGESFFKVGRDAKVVSNVFTSGGAVVRNAVSPVLNGEHSETYLNGFTAIGHDQHVDNFTVIDHAQPNCFSRELYKGVYDDRSSGAFSGTILVRPGAQKTNAIQSNRSILLSDNATANAQPQLKIYADDVKCTHGATVGQLDSEALFYLRSRGIREVEARTILMRAFAEEVFDGCSNQAVREWLSAVMLKRFS